MSPPAKQRTELSATAYVDVFPKWLGTRTTSELIDRLRTELSWEARSINLFGKSVMQPRLITWVGSVPYRYSGLELPARQEPDCLAEVSEQVRALAGVPFNHTLLNRYRDGHDYMGWHADNERELGRDPTIACLSLGASRTLSFKPRGDNEGHALALELADGDLLIMSGTIQHDFVHCLPKRKRVTDERISLTYRWLRP